MRLFDDRIGTWRVVSVDNCFPCDDDGAPHAAPRAAQTLHMVTVSWRHYMATGDITRLQAASCTTWQWLQAGVLHYITCGYCRHASLRAAPPRRAVGARTREGFRQAVRLLRRPRRRADPVGTARDDGRPRVHALTRRGVYTRVAAHSSRTTLPYCTCMGVTCTTPSRRRKNARRSRYLVITPGGRRVEAPRHAHAADGRQPAQGAAIRDLLACLLTSCSFARSLAYSLADLLA